MIAPQHADLADAELMPFLDVDYERDSQVALIDLGGRRHCKVDITIGIVTATKALHAGANAVRIENVAFLQLKTIAKDLGWKYPAAFDAEVAKAVLPSGRYVKGQGKVMLHSVLAHLSHARLNLRLKVAVLLPCILHPLLKLLNPIGLVIECATRDVTRQAFLSFRRQRGIAYELNLRNPDGWRSVPYFLLVMVGLLGSDMQPARPHAFRVLGKGRA